MYIYVHMHGTKQKRFKKYTWEGSCVAKGENIEKCIIG